MSALCGIVHLDQSPVAAEDLDKMMQAIAHRGLDGAGTWLWGQVALGHQMFHITPESLTEELPRYDPEARLAITAVARLDNREELLHLLDIQAAEQVGLADSTIILRAYEKWGRDCPKHLLGDFAFVIWDGRLRELVGATDHMGVQSFYYCHTGKKFIFASEIKAILAHPDVRQAINLKKIALLIWPAMSLVDKETTYFENILQVPGATVLTVNSGKMEKHEYWEPDLSKAITFSDENDYREAFQEIFFKAVAARLRSAFPVVSLLSGGLDSSSVTATASRLLKSSPPRLPALAAVLPPGYQGSGTDERQYIDELQGIDNLDIHYISDPWRGPFDDLERLVWGGESPDYTSRHYQYTAFAEAAGRLQARVILEGAMGEFGPSCYGEGYYAELFCRGRWKRLAQELVARSSLENRTVLKLILKEVLAPLVPAALLARLRPRFDAVQTELSFPLQKDFVLGQLGPEIGRWRQLSRSLGEVAPRHRQNQMRNMLLARGSVYGRGFVGYERVYLAIPFLDRRVLEFCLALPGEFKVNRGYRRYALRAGMAGLLPEALRWRTSKEPFAPDYHDRYNRTKSRIGNIIAAAEKQEALAEIVDFDKLKHLSQQTMHGSRGSTPADFAALQAVPGGIYLLCFLQQYVK